MVNDGEKHLNAVLLEERVTALSDKSIAFDIALRRRREACMLFKLRASHARKSSAINILRRANQRAASRISHCCHD